MGGSEFGFGSQVVESLVRVFGFGVLVTKLTRWPNLVSKKMVVVGFRFEFS